MKTEILPPRQRRRALSKDARAWLDDHGLTESEIERPREEVRALIESHALTQEEVARVLGIHRLTLVQLLNGSVKGRYGDAGFAAIALGIKAKPCAARKSAKPQWTSA